MFFLDKNTLFVLVVLSESSLSSSKHLIPAEGISVGNLVVGFRSDLWATGGHYPEASSICLFI